MVLPNSSNSRLTALKNARINRSRQERQQQHGQQQQQNIADYLKKTNPLPASVHRPPPPKKSPTPPRVLSESQNTTPVHNNKILPVHNSKILEGIIAYLDVRTEDGDDVSQNFERALHSMGAKTRRAFSDSVTHLIFKNGSPSTLKKAMSKNVFIVSLLWISSCKRKGERVPEKEYMIDKSQGLVVTTGKKRRKSMEPSKVRALVMNDSLQSSLSSSSEEGSTQEENEPKRKKLSICSWETTDFNSSKEKTPKRKSVRPNFDEDPASAVPAEIKLNTPRLSLPISIETSINKSSPSETIIPIHAPSLEKKEQIKARFSVGKNTTEEEIPTPLARVILPVSSPLKRRRRLTGNLTRVHSTDTLQPIKYTIVLTSVSTNIRKQCEEAIKKFDLFELASEVTERTTHVLVGANRRTKSVTLGLLRGLWMLSPEWLVQSGQKNVMVSEKEYELSDWYPRTEYRKQQPLLNPSTPHIHVVSSRSGVELVQDMIKMAGGSVVKVESLADILISDTPIVTDKIVVTDTWLFDMIEQWQYLPTNNYLLDKKI